MTYTGQVVNLKRWLGSFTITPIGVALLAMLGGAVAIALLGPRVAQAPAFVVAVVVALLVLAGGLSGGHGGLSTKSLEDRRAEFGTRPSDSPNKNLESPVEAELWRHERDRYEKRRETP